MSRGLFDLGGKVVLSTGANSGIGLAFLHGCARHFSSITPLGRPGYMADIEGPAVYLASDASRFHTGDMLVVDGGRTVNSK